VTLAGLDFVILHESDGEDYGLAIPAVPYIEAEIAELKRTRLGMSAGALFAE
jgi:hypothetical protein